MIRVVVLCDQGRQQEELLSLLRQEGFLVHDPVDGPDELPARMPAWAPEAVVLVEPFGGLESAELVAQLRASLPTAALVVATRKAEPAHLRQLFRQGADDVLTLPRELPAIPNTIRDVVAVRRNPREAETGKVAAIWSPKGGVGCSLLAAHLAVAIQVELRKRTLLADLDGPDGSIEIYLGLEPDRNLGHLFRVIPELNPLHLTQATVEHPSGLTVLCAANQPAPAGGLQAEQVPPLIRMCRHMWEVTLLDLPSGWRPVVAAALETVDRLALVVTPDAPAVRAAQAACQRLSPATLHRTGVVVNRSSRQAEIRPEEAAQYLNLPLIGAIPADFAALEPAINTGSPLTAAGGTSARTLAIVKEMNRLAQRLV